VNYWRPYFLGKSFEVITDHQSLTWLQGLNAPKGRLARWIVALQDYEFGITHCAGRNNGNADALSRFPQPLTTRQIVDEGLNEEIRVGVAATYVCSTWTPGDIRTAQQEDTVIVQVIEQLNKPKGEAESEEKWKQNDELKRYRQLWMQLIMLDGILHRRVDQGSPEERTVLVVLGKCAQIC
jgi:hypothetical protein